MHLFHLLVIPVQDRMSSDLPIWLKKLLLGLICKLALWTAFSRNAKTLDI